MTEFAAKLSVSVPADLARDVRAHLGKRGLSAFVATALRHELERRRLGAYLEELDTTYGPVPPRIKERARRAWSAR